MTSSTCWLKSNFSGVTTSNNNLPCHVSYFLTLHSESGRIDASSTARVQRGSSETARCASKEDARFARFLYLDSHLFRFRNHFFDRADHVERLFREMVVFAIENFLEASHRVFELHVLTGRAGKGFGDVERL